MWQAIKMVFQAIYTLAHAVNEIAGAADKAAGIAHKEVTGISDVLDIEREQRIKLLLISTKAEASKAKS